jgi:hypothetical protein
MGGTASRARLSTQIARNGRCQANKQVKCRHTAALAMVGWYLIVPPWRGPGAFNTDAPLSAWLMFGSFNSADQCSNEQDRRVRNLRNAINLEERKRSFNERLYTAAKCIASNDPRLKGY